jgi:hypothetical protein
MRCTPTGAEHDDVDWRANTLTAQGKISTRAGRMRDRAATSAGAAARSNQVIRSERHSTPLPPTGDEYALRWQQVEAGNTFGTGDRRRTGDGWTVARRTQLHFHRVWTDDQLHILTQPLVSGRTASRSAREDIVFTAELTRARRVAGAGADRQLLRALAE